MIDNHTEYLLQLFQSQVERGFYDRAAGLLKLLSPRLAPSEIDRLQLQIPKPLRIDKVVCPSASNAEAKKRKQEMVKTSAKSHKREKVKVKTSPKKRKPPKAKIKTPAADVKRVQEIQAIINRQKIPYLIHFTQACNVSSVLKHGLIPRKLLRVRLGRPYKKVRINDPKRLDHHTDANCLSVSFPNFRMFFRYQQNDPEICWAVLRIKTDILWKMDCAFCTTNAASSCIRSKPIKELKQASALATLFNDYENELENMTRSSLSIPDYFPTNPQAEVLVFDTIPVGDIETIYLKEHSESSTKFINAWGSVPVKFNQLFFGPRVDYRCWQNQIAN